MGGKHHSGQHRPGVEPPPPEGWADYVCSYRYQGKEWGFHIRATSFADAQARLNAPHFGRVEGELHEIIPATEHTLPLIRLYVRLKTWWKNRRDQWNRKTA